MELNFKGPESIFKNGKSSECVCCGDRQLNKKAKATRPPIQKAGISGVIQATLSRLFRRRVQLCQKISSFQTTRGGHHRNYASLADKRKVRRHFRCFSENACSFVKRSRIRTTTCCSESKGASFRNRRGACSEIEEAYLEIEEAPLFQKAGIAGSKRLSTRVKSTTT